MGNNWLDELIRSYGNEILGVDHIIPAYTVLRRVNSRVEKVLWEWAFSEDILLEEFLNLVENINIKLVREKYSISFINISKKEEITKGNSSNIEDLIEFGNRVLLEVVVSKNVVTHHNWIILKRSNSNYRGEQDESDALQNKESY